MQGPALVTGLVVVFAAIAGLMGVLGLFYSPVTLGVAVPFAVASAILWYQASGRLQARMRRRAAAGSRPNPGFRFDGRDGSGFGGRDASSGPRGPRFGDSRFRGSGFGDDRVGAGVDGGARPGDGRRGGRTGGEGGPATGGNGLSRREARRILGVGADASQGDLRRAYRERAKTLHPDRGGDDEAFGRLTRAYERLRP